MPTRKVQRVVGELVERPVAPIIEQLRTADTRTELVRDVEVRLLRHADGGATLSLTPQDHSGDVTLLLLQPGEYVRDSLAETRRFPEVEGAGLETGRDVVIPL